MNMLAPMVALTSLMLVHCAAGQDPQQRLFDQPMDFSTSPPLPTVDAPTVEQIRQSIDRGIDFLLSDQNPDGSWGSHVSPRDFEIYAPVPGAHHAFRAAVTALCVSALLETDPQREQVIGAVDRAKKWMFDNLPRLKRATGDAIYNVWGHAYAIPALIQIARSGRVSDQEVQQIRQLIADQIEMLERYESVDGGWGYYDFRAQARKPTGSSISFVNATVIIALKDAAQFGVQPPQLIVDRAIAAIKRQQKPDFSYLYGEYLQYEPMMDINRPGGSLGRSQACNLALRVWGDPQITDNVIKWWLVRLYVRNGWLDIARKLPVPHESWMSVSGYFYYYGHYYAGLEIDVLPTAQRAPYQAMLARLMLKHQEINGCWWDYPMYNYHRQYGTAYALMALQRCLPEEQAGN